MPRIDPNQLLKCLSALLGTSGGIKSTQEVKRIATLMTKFSKKLVSKCIYIQILKSTQSDLLVEFMAEGGWALVFQWLDDAIVNNNYPLIREILELLLLCPISLERLKENNCPKVVKGLSKDSEDELVKQLAGKLVEQWLKFIKSGQAAISDVAIAAAAAAAALGPKPATATPPKTAVVKPLPVQPTPMNETVKKVPVIRKINKIRVSQGDEKSSSDEEVPPIGSLPLYKITVRDGKSVLAKVGTKTLTLTTKKPESDAESAAAVVLKSEAGAKKFRYVAKPASEKEKSDVSENTSDDSSSREKPGESVAGSEKRESKTASDESSESSEKDKSKSSSKSSKDIKSKDSYSKSKTHRDKDKSESKHKDKDRKESSDKRKSDHKSHKSDKDRDRDRDRDKNKHKESSSKDKHKDGEKSSRDKDKKDSKSLTSAEKAQIQADKDKDTLERLKTPAISSLGKIPKKSSSQSSNSSSSKNVSSSKSTESPSSDKSNSDASKKSGEVRRPEVKGPKPKTVKTFNSKFRSTGLEEEIKPPPPRSSIKKKVEEKKPVIASAAGSAVNKPEVSSLKHPSPSPKDGSPPEKKSKIAEVIAEKKDKIVDKPGGIKLIPPKPKPALLESDMFSDALIASTRLEPRKRKRRTSGSKDGPDIKKETKDESGSSAASPKDVKPNLKFYRDTLEDDDEKNKENTDIKTEIKTESDSEESKQTGDGDENTPISKLYPNGVLVHKMKRGPKKSVKWKEESDLITVKYFELDETERVNVTRNFVDMKVLERSHEREAFQLARKLASDDIMEERIPYGPLYEIDIPPERRPTVEPGRSSEEKNVQYAREKTVLQAIYFHRNSIPDSPSEPDPESHPTTDPKIIPLDDITGNADSIQNFTNMPWPEPKATLIPSSPPPTQTAAPAPGGVGFPAGYSTVGNFPGFPAMGMPGVMPTGQGTWRTGDGKDMPMPMNFQPNGPMIPPQMGQPNMFPPEGYNMNGPMAPGFNPGYGMGCDPSMYGPPPMGGMTPQGPPPQWNRGGWGQGPRGPCPPMNMPPKFPKGVCHHFAKFGNCSRGNSCRFMHPGVNCPPLT